MVLHYCAW